MGKISWRKAWQPTPAFLPREFHGQRSLEGYSPWGCTELDTVEALSMQETNSVIPLNKTKTHAPKNPLCEVVNSLSLHMSRMRLLAYTSEMCWVDSSVELETALEM